MIVPIEFPNFEQYTRNIPIEVQGVTFTGMTFGAGSYLVSGNLEYGSPICHVLVGKYCSLGHRLTFEVGLNHDGGRVTTYPFRDLRVGSSNATVNHYYEANQYQIVIGNDVWIGADVTILGGVHIGNGVVIGARAVVAKDIPPYAVAVGNPARVVKYRFPEEIIQKLQAIKWWHWPVERVKSLVDTGDVENFVNTYYAPIPRVEDDTAKFLQKMRAEGTTICIFSPVLSEDDEEPCRHVLEQYIRDFHAGDPIALFIEIEGEGNPVRPILDEVGQGKNNLPEILFYKKGGAVPLAILQNADYLITTKNFRSLVYMDYGADYGVKRLYAWSEDVFGRMREKNKTSLQEKHPILTLEEKKQKVEESIRQRKAGIQKLMEDGEREAAMQEISGLANLLYNYNQEYTDDFLEECLLKLKANLGTISFFDGDKDLILFYDGFGLDTRGLAQIYLDAIGELGCRPLYIASENARGHIPTLEQILEKYQGKAVYYGEGSQTESCHAICKIIMEHRPTRGFLYTTPWDVPGILAFMRLDGSMLRYQVDLTDHAFWLGRNAFDYCQEERDYGASIAVLYRKIPGERISEIHDYPMFVKDVPFQGYPFEKQAGDFVIFSGGALYKTLDEGMTYYKLLDVCLSRHANVKFWYAGLGDDRGIQWLMGRHPGRVFHTKERKDLMEILRHVDMYLNTYPMFGGLMVRYSAAAGRAPLTLRHGDEGSGLLIRQRDLGIEFDTAEELQVAMDRFITEPGYRESLEKDIKKAVYTKKGMLEYFRKALWHPEPHSFHIYPVDTTEFRRWQMENFFKNYMQLYGIY